MAAENRTDLATTLAALAAVVDLSELKAVLTNFIDSMLMKRDVQNTVTVTGAGTTNVDFDGYDTVKVSTGYDCTLNIQNINDGDVKFLWLSKTSRVTVVFTGATSQEIDTTYTTTLTDIIYIVTKKFYGTVVLAPLTKSFAFNRKIVEIGAWNMDANSTVNVAHGLTSTKIRNWDVIIYDDGGLGYKFEKYGAGSTELTATNIVLDRINGGDYDSTDFDNSVDNRGYVTIWYTD